MGCSWTGPELASWPEKPQPTSENMPSLGKGEGGGGPSIKGVFPWGAVWPCPRPHPSLHPLLSALSPGLVLVTCLKVGSGCPPVSGQTPRHSNFHSFCINPAGWCLRSPIPFSFSLLVVFFFFSFFFPSSLSFSFFRVHSLVFSPPPGEGRCFCSPPTRWLGPSRAGDLGWGWGVPSPGWEGSLPSAPLARIGLGLGTSWHWDQSISRVSVVVFNALTLLENECEKVPTEAGWSICSGWGRLWSALQVPSCPTDTWHFKRELAALSAVEVTPRRWGNAVLPFCICMTSAQ